VHETKPRNLMRARAGAERVTNVELFFDLVYVFAVTQISHYLLAHRTPTGALRAGLLLAMIWLVWVYTTWVTNWLDPDQIAVRLLLLGLAVASLIMSAALPAAFSARGLAVGVAYAVMQIGRSVFAVLALRGRPLQRNFQRTLWVAAVGVDLLGGTVGFYTPGLGRSTTREWTIEGGHFAERCQAFMLIAFGESIVAIGATLSGLAHVGIAEIAAFAVAICGSIGLWWLYFDRSAGDAARVIAASDDPGRLGRSAYHLIHPVMVAGIIVSAAADEVALADPGAVGRTATSWMILGGAALFLAGHAAFKAVVWRTPSWPRIGAVAVLALLGLAAPHISALALGACAAAVIVAVAVIDYVRLSGEGAGTDSPAAGQRD
jgi:low temperature requirement protein LtrA